MSDFDQIEREEQEQETAIKPRPVSEDKPGKRFRAFDKIGRELSEKELGSPGVQRLLIQELERLQREVDHLSDYRDRFYEADKGRAVLEQRLKVSIASDVTFGVFLTIGAALATLAPAVWDKRAVAWVLLGMGVVLVMGGIIAKVVKA